jgi:hypothetical protein
LDVQDRLVDVLTHHWLAYLRRGILRAGDLSNEGVAFRAAIVFVLFVPIGYDERVLGKVGFEVEAAEDRTEDVALVAGR